ncbi:DNA repair protein RadC [bacterium]|nr:DNA repair protein RadC [bacterium]
MSASSFFDTLEGEFAIVAGHSRGLLQRLSAHYRRVIAADSAARPAPLSQPVSIGESAVQYLTGREASPDRLPTSVDLVVLPFLLSGLDQAADYLTDWAALLRDRGRIAVIEWAWNPSPRPVDTSSLHHRFLESLEAAGRVHLPSSRELIQLLRAAGLTHARVVEEDGTGVFNDDDRTFMATEALHELEQLGRGDSGLANTIRSEGLVPGRIRIAHAFAKKPGLSSRRAGMEDDAQPHDLPADGQLQRPEGKQRRETAGELVQLLVPLLQGEVARPKETAEHLLATFGVKGMASLTDETHLVQLAGLPQQAAGRILDALALGRRLYAQMHGERPEIHGPRDAYDYLADEMRSLKREQFRGLYLNVRGNLERDEVISLGTLTAALVHPREVFGPAIEHGCHSVLLAHNHPSGDPNPSMEDVHLTRELAEAGRLLGIELLDHIVIGANSFVSLKEKGYF